MICSFLVLFRTKSISFAFFRTQNTADRGNTTTMRGERLENKPKPKQPKRQNSPLSNGHRSHRKRVVFVRLAFKIEIYVCTRFTLNTITRPLQPNQSARAQSLDYHPWAWSSCTHTHTCTTINCSRDVKRKLKTNMMRVFSSLFFLFGTFGRAYLLCVCVCVWMV